MSATVVPVVRRPVNRKYERVFFAGMAVLLAVTVLIGFWPSYFSKGAVVAPLRSPLVHFHGAAFTLWMVLFLVQVGLVATKRVKVHMTLGLAVFGLAVVMVVLGVMTATAQLKRESADGPHELDPHVAYVLPMGDLVAFVPLVFLAYWMRRKTDTHKRLALIATISLMGAPLARFPVHELQADVFGQTYVIAVFCLMMVAYDWYSLGRVHKATIWGSVGLLLVHAVRFPIAFTPAWRWFGDHMVKLV